MKWKRELSLKQMYRFVKWFTNLHYASKAEYGDNLNIDIRDDFSLQI